jgi:hypothetical protein
MKVKPKFQCSKCKFIFKRDENLQRHLKRKRPCIENYYLKENIEARKGKKKPEQIIKNIERIENEDDYESDIEEELIPDKTILTEIQEFEIKSLLENCSKENFSMIIAGARRSGKTTLMLYLYPYFLKMYDIVMFFSFSLHNKLYKDIKYPKFDKFSSQVLEDLQRFQKLTNNAYNVLVIFDDMNSGQLKQDDSIRQMYIRGRNSNISVLITTQDLTLLGPNNRRNTDYMFIGKTNSVGARQRIVEDFLLPIIKFDEKIQKKSTKEALLNAWIMDQTKDHNFLLIDFFEDGENIYNFKVKK